MAYWLFKSEPGDWSWDDHLAKGVEPWTGVRNYQATNNMKAMALGERGFFYHSVNEKRIVGIVEVVSGYYPDPTDTTGKWGLVDLKAITSVPTPITLAEIKADPRLAEMILVKNSRLSVQPVRAEEWAIICALMGLPPENG